MPALALVQTAILVGAALAAVRLWSNRLWRHYPVFFCYLILQILISTLPLALDVRAPLYFWLWFFSEIVNVVLYVSVVLELCSLVLRKHRGIYTLGRWAIYAGLTVAIAVSVIAVIPNIRPAAGQRSVMMPYILAADRGVTLSMAIFLVLMMVLLKGYPVPLSRNVVVHATLCAIFFVSNTAGVVLAGALGRELYGKVSSGVLVISALCMFVWFLSLSPAGEEVKVQLPKFSPEHEERVLYQLDALNATMLKISRK